MDSSNILLYPRKVKVSYIAEYPDRNQILGNNNYTNIWECINDVGHAQLQEVAGPWSLQDSALDQHQGQSLQLQLYT